MVQRLGEKYELHDAVEVYLQQPDGNGRWAPGRVERHDFPGLWVRLENGSRWFVTNGRRIRPRREAAPGQ